MDVRIAAMNRDFFCRTVVMAFVRGGSGQITPAFPRIYSDTNLTKPQTITIHVIHRILRYWSQKIIWIFAQQVATALIQDFKYCATRVCTVQQDRHVKWNVALALYASRTELVGLQLHGLMPVEGGICALSKIGIKSFLLNSHFLGHF